MKSKHTLSWLLSHSFGFIFLNFSYDVRDFWWSEEDILDKEQNVKFRYLKIWLANCIALFFICLLPFLYGIFTSNDINGLIFIFKLFTLIYGVGALVATLYETYRMAKNASTNPPYSKTYKAPKESVREEHDSFL